MNTMDIRLQQAIAAARAGKRDEARVLLDRFLADQPDDVQGIFLRSTLAISKEERVDDLRQVLSIEPDHRGAKLMLERLGEPVEVEPPAAEPVEFEPVEDELMDDVPATIVHAIEEPEMEITLEDEEPVVVTEEDLPFEDIEATAVVLIADDVQDEVIEAIDWPIEDEVVEPVIEETMIAYPDEPIIEEDEEFPELEEEEVPEWLTDEAAFKAEAEMAQEEAIDGEDMPLEMGELPDWLQEEPTEEWLSQEQIETPESVDELPDGWAAEPVIIPEGDFAPMPFDASAPQPKKKRKKVSKKSLEIVLGLLIFLAVLVMVGLVYVFFTL